MHELTVVRLPNSFNRPYRFEIISFAQLSARGTQLSLVSLCNRVCGKNWIALGIYTWSPTAFDFRPLRPYVSLDIANRAEVCFGGLWMELDGWGKLVTLVQEVSLYNMLKIHNLFLQYCLSSKINLHSWVNLIVFFVCVRKCLWSSFMLFISFKQPRCSPATLSGLKCRPIFTHVEFEKRKKTLANQLVRSRCWNRFDFEIPANFYSIC